jgi:hypothetical protein
MKKIILSVLILAVFILISGCATASSPGSTLRGAAYEGDLATVRAKLDAGADVNASSGAGETAVSNAASHGHVAVVKLLLDRGADLDQALSHCEELVDYWRTQNIVARESTTCLRLLRSFKAEREEAKRQEQETARAQALEAQRAQQMKAMLQEVVAATSKGQKEQVKSAAVRSDIDKPEFAESERIMGDDDLAVIIGIEGYQNLPKSDYSYDDAKLVKEYVKALGFKERNIELLTDEKATKSSIEKSLEAWLKNKAKHDSRVFVYYSGHGAPDSSTGEAYIVPYDGDPNYLPVTGYPLKRLYERLGKLDAKEIVVVLDSCFSGSGGRSVLAKGVRPLVMVAETASLSSNVAVLTATQGSQISTSSPEKGHGIFTYYFLKAIKDGRRNLAEIYEYIKPLIEDEAKMINIQQSPSISPDIQKLKGSFGLRN